MKLDARRWPIPGDPEAEYMFVFMFDYTCPHCRAAHATIRGAQQHFGDRLVILVMTVPLERACNLVVKVDDPIHAGACDLSRLTVAVWQVQPTAFPTFHNWLMEGQRTPQSYWHATARPNLCDARLWSVQHHPAVTSFITVN